MNFKKNLVIINNRKFFYWEKNHNKKEVIVLLHGFPGCHKGLIEMAEGLNNYRLIIPDLPACGISDSLSGEHNLNSYSQWLYDFLEILSIKNPIIIGHSFGSRISLIFSIHYPELIKEIVLITPVVEVGGLIARFVSVEYGIAKILPKYLKEKWLSNNLHRKIGDLIIFKSASPKRIKKLMAREVEDYKNFNAEINMELFDEFYKFSLIEDGKKVKTKSLVIAGELDEIAPLNSVKKFAEQLTNSEFIIMKGCGHIVVAEKPLTTAGIIRNWLEKKY